MTFRQLLDVADVHYGKSPSEVLSKDGTIPVIGTGGIYRRAVRPLFCGPAVVVPRKGSLGNPQYVDGPFWPVDTTYAVLPKRNIDARWLYYSLDRFDLTKPNEATGVPSISRDWLYKIPLSSVDLEQQRRIAEILSTLDEAIEQTEALIAKTQQIKAGLMHDLFTHGVTADGQLRPPREEAPQLYKASGLGWIPKVWEVATLKAVSEFVTSGSRGWATFYSEDGPLFIRIGNLTREHPNLRLNNVVHVHPPVSSEGQRTRLIEGDLLISITADLGIIGIVPPNVGEAYINQHIALVRIDQRLANSRWLGHLLGAPRAQAWIRRLDDPGAKAGLNLPTVRAFPIVLPPAYEQDEVVRRLDAADDLIRREQACAHKLNLLKHALMHDLLTGRMQVLEDYRIAEVGS